MGLSLNPGHSDYWTSGLTAGKQGHGESCLSASLFQSPPCLPSGLGFLAECHSLRQGGGGRWRAKCQARGRGRCFESKKPPELLAAIETRAFVGGDARYELLPKQWPSRAWGDWAGSGPWPQTRPGRPRGLQNGAHLTMQRQLLAAKCLRCLSGAGCEASAVGEANRSG